MNKTTLNSQKEKHSIANFYPRSPCGERPYTLSLPRRRKSDFYPRSPCGERLHIGRGCVMIHRISIHALLAESDTTKVAGLLALIYISIHALLAESDGSSAVFSGCCTGISIHALLAESDADRIGYAVRLLYFYPRSPCGERPQEVSVRRGVALFLSTLSLRRATSSQRLSALQLFQFLSTLSLRRATHVRNTLQYCGNYFYPRSPCGERRYLIAVSHPHGAISIHALLAESDLPLLTVILRLVNFYPRSPCGERPPLADGAQARATFLSTLSLRRATRHWQTGQSRTRHFYPRSPCGERPVGDTPPCCGCMISIHALLAESDLTFTFTLILLSVISIHALLAESDFKANVHRAKSRLFLSTLSLRRATILCVLPVVQHTVFLSTLSLRRATVIVRPDIRPLNCYFYPRSPCGERRRQRCY